MSSSPPYDVWMYTREGRAHPAPPHQPSGYGGNGYASLAASTRIARVMEPAPPYLGEGPHALWHVSDDDSIRRFEPREGRVWAIDTRHLPLYWFPRQCPRATFWADSGTTPEDVVRFLGGDRARRVHVVERGWMDAMSSARVVAYRLPADAFEPWDRFWISASAVEPIERIELGDLAARHADAGIELRTETTLIALWKAVVASTLDYSGIRLRNAVPA